jgi:hypothetical protein
VYIQAPDSTGAIILSSWVDPGGTNGDQYCYDDFTLTSSQTISEIHWRGGYSAGGIYGRATGFTVTIYGSIPGGSQPAVVAPDTTGCALPGCLAQYRVTGNAGEVPVAGTGLYDYQFVLTPPFPATAGVKYWVQIEASQSVFPDWGIAVGTGGDTSHYQYFLPSFHTVASDAAFSLWVANNPPVAANQAEALAENMTAVTTVVATDIDGNPLTYRVVTQPAHGILTGIAPNLIYAPAVNYAGPDSFTFMANDGLIDSNLATVSITVEPAVRVMGVTGDFPLLQAAYDNPLTTNGAEIRIRAVPLVENLLFHSSKTVSIKGGFDATFNQAVINGMTTVQGSVIISSGSVVIDRVVIQ